MFSINLKILSILFSPITWFVFLWGACIGSFLNVCILRIPEKTFWKSARSACPSCGATIPFYLNVPILSWFFLRGKTACCKQRLSFIYPLVEFLTGFLFVMIYWKYPFIVQKSDIWEVDYPNLLRALHGCVFVSILVVCSFIDFKLMIIPDVISLPMIALTPLIAWLHPDLSMLTALIGALAGGGILYLIAWAYWLVRKEVGMGMGDVKLLAGIGGWLGYQSIIPTVFYGSILGASLGIAFMAAKRTLTLKSAIPFGPFLAIGAIIHLMMGSYLQELLLYLPRSGIDH
jgi:leader peptidase (prepilin peptidase)/N-methyltransferase